MSGWASLGSVLGGGIEREKAFEDGRYRSAQTEQALMSARKNQADALAQERNNEVTGRLLDAGFDPTTATGATLGEVMLAGHGGDFQSLLGGLKTRQEIDMRSEIANPGTSVDQLQRNRAALGSAAFDHIQPLGERGYVDYLQPDPGPLPLGEEFLPANDPTSAAQNYQMWVDLGGKPGPDAFAHFARPEQIVQGGNVPYVRPIGGGAPAAPVVAPTQVATNLGQQTDAKTTATTQSKLRVALPGVYETLDTMDQSIDGLLAQPGFDTIYGLSGDIDPRNYIKGSDASNALAARTNLTSQAFTVAIQKMRGLGALSNAEGAKVESALTRATDPRLSEEEAREAFADFKERLAQLRIVAEQEAGVSVREFATEAEAEAAGIKPGTRVIIGGVPGTWE